jgi:hypothetical protein
VSPRQASAPRGSISGKSIGCSVTCGSGEPPIGVQFLTSRHAWLVVLRRRQASGGVGKETLLPKGKV